MQHRIAGITALVLLLAQRHAAAAGGADAPSTSSAQVTPPAPQQVDDATRARARRIAEEGLALFDAGKYAEALDHFDRAGALVKAPTMALLAGRSLEKLGRLVEASERYLAASSMKLEAGASDAFRTAQADAAKERAALSPRIPTLTIAFDGAPAETSVTLDGQAVSAARLASAIPVDPGEHTVVATRAGATKEEKLTLRQGESRKLAIALPAPASPGSPLRTAAWIGVAAGGAGLLAGAIAGGVLVSTKSRLDDAGCPAHCPDSTAADLSTYNSLRPVTTAALAAGGALAVAGGLVLILGPSPKDAPKTGSYRARPSVSIAPFVGVGSAGVRGVF